MRVDQDQRTVGTEEPTVFSTSSDGISAGTGVSSFYLSVYL
ncbi:MAG: hypothetical protein AAF845_02125 [Bacteroidota bacterium]